MAVKVTEALRQEAREYYALCSEAQDLGIPVSCDDPCSPQTTAALRREVMRMRWTMPCDLCGHPLEDHWVGVCP